MIILAPNAGEKWISMSIYHPGQFIAVFNSGQHQAELNLHPEAAQALEAVAPTFPNRVNPQPPPTQQPRPSMSPPVIAHASPSMMPQTSPPILTQAFSPPLLAVPARKPVSPPVAQPVRPTIHQRQSSGIAQFVADSTHIMAAVIDSNSGNTSQNNSSVTSNVDGGVYVDVTNVIVENDYGDSTMSGSDASFWQPTQDSTYDLI